MADPDKLRSLRKAGLAAPPTIGAGNVDKAEPVQAAKPEPEPAAPVEEPPKKRGGTGRPPLDYPTRQLGARVHADTFTRVQAIARRERVGLGPLVDRMVAAWERQRLEEAKAIGPRLDGEDDDTYIARIFKL